MTFNNSVNAASYFKKDKVIIKIDFCNYPWMGDVSYNVKGFKTNTPALQFETDYKFLNYLETGIYWGFSFYEHVDFSPLDKEDKDILSDNTTMSIEQQWKPMFVYGISADLQLLPLILKSNNSFIDLYISSKYGTIYFADKNKSVYSRKRSQMDYGVYGGIAIYPFKYLGLYYEYGTGNYLKWKTGLRFRF
jgi:hypothetical protein